MAHNMSDILRFTSGDNVELDRLSNAQLRKLAYLLFVQQNAANIAAQMLINEIAEAGTGDKKTAKIVETFADAWNEIAVVCSNDINTILSGVTDLRPN